MKAELDHQITKLLQGNNRWLRIALQARLRDQHAVDEVMQEVSLAVVQGIAKVKDQTKIKPWLYQVAIRQAMLYRRKLGRRKKLEQTAEQSGDIFEHKISADSTPVGIEWLISKERNQLINQTMNQLPRRDAEILMLKYIEGWKYQQIAEHLGLSTSAVEARLFRARSRLRKLLDQQQLQPN